MSMADKVWHRVKKSLQYSYRKSLNVAFLFERHLIQAPHHFDSIPGDTFKTANQLCARQASRRSKFCIAIAIVSLAANACDTPLLKISGQMQEQIGNTVQLAAWPAPNLLVTELADAVANLPQ